MRNKKLKSKQRPAPAEFTIPFPHGFSFWRTVFSHGWCALPLFHVDKAERRFRAVIPKGGDFVEIALCEDEGLLRVSVGGGSSHQQQETRDMTQQISSMLRMGESFDQFYAEAKRHPQYRWIAVKGAGRLLRCPTVFEDVVKMICTTNCSWALTEIMVDALVTKLGTNLHGDVFSFPAPEAIASHSESFLRKEIHCGYRAPYLLELSRKILEGKISIEEWRTSAAPTEELFKLVGTVKGVGPYAAGNILKLLGRYNYLGLDSWCRRTFFEMFTKGRKVKDSTIEKHYAAFGKWRGLFLWMDVTKDWHTGEFPF